MTFLKSRRVGVIAAVLLLVAGGLVVRNVLSGEQAAPASLETFKGASAEAGRYLAIAGNCASCHTVDGGSRYAGGRQFHTPFGILYSTNITPDSETGIGNWSFEDFYRSMKYGVRPNGEHLYPAFPFTSFAKMTDEDIASLYLYIQSLEPVRNPARENELRFPFNQRSMLAGWKVLFHDSSTYTPDEQKSAEWNRGAYLVEGVAHCGACHTPRNAMGAERKDLALTGGVYMDKVKLGGYRQWSAVNLTPSETGLGDWTREDIVEYLRTGQNAHTVIHGPMNKVVMDSTHHMTEEDRVAIATYLKGIPANAQPTGPAPDEDSIAAGKTVYTVHCGSCHLPTGLGDSTLGVPLVKNSIVQAADPSTLLNVILYGPEVPPPPFLSDRSRMKMYGKRLSDEDIANVANYLRASFGHGAGRVTPDQVKRQR
ncbi:MAG TPA: cytochrome c [Porticoccaceae bacterium]